jgi:cytochrome P450
VLKGETSLSLQLAQFFATLNDRVVPSFKHMLQRTFVPGWDSEFQKTKVAVTRVVNEIIESTKQQLADETAGKIESGKSNLLREMIRATLDSDSFTDEELRHEILTIMLAGYDTTSILLRFVHNWKRDFSKRS